MRTQGKQKLTPLQRKQLVKIAVFLLCAAVAWVVFAPGMGVHSWLKQRKELEHLQSYRDELEHENEELRKEIEKIENDIEYFEKIAREKHGLLKRNEILFDFSREEKNSSKKKE